MAEKWFLKWKSEAGKKGQGPAVWTKEEAIAEARRLSKKYPHLTISAKKAKWPD